MKCVLHVGIHKTGSSAIQEAFDGYDDGMTRYADLGDCNHSIPLQIIFDRDLAADHQKRMGLSEAEMQAEALRLVQRLDQALEGDLQQLILSGEEVSAFPEHSLAALREHLLRAADEINVLMFVREPLNWQASVYQEVLKYGETDPFHTGNRDIRGRYVRLANVFGTDNVRVVKYEDKRQHGGDIISFFCDLIGVDRGQLCVDGTHVNKSLSEQATKILYRHNCLYPYRAGGGAVFQAHLNFFFHLSEIFDKDGKLDHAMFGVVVDKDDYIFLKDELGVNYDLSFPTDKDVVAYLDDIDPAAIAKIGSFLASHGFDYDYASDPDMAISTLFQFCAAQSFIEMGTVPNTKVDQLIAKRDQLEFERDHARRFPWKYLGQALGLKR
ncbi:hypothetical protein [uncultured Roseovarius sp.]|uniref:hypothetical protein n=1 Tax=uncultured Roseovarius sp. TaxID=293344 RepID=UPI0026149EC7|nr:hypothetical protein [uncultured Roseovarius sp.]